MRYMLMHKVDDADPAAWSPTPEFLGRMGGFMAEVDKAGVLLAAEGLAPSSAGAAVIRVKNGTQTVVDGPFAEAKEVIAGFAILQVRDHAEAVEWAQRFGALFEDIEVEIEVRRVPDHN
ncbi:YciI family protein [Dactylosporangium sp. NPDC005555]|uniref:YciI family protein n=1 Tax=Dactylosporangium sp. NPDC005555 TaxID=3154889 RepID=UPI00339FE7BD